MAGVRMPPRGAEVWEFNAWKNNERVYGSWAMRGAEQTEVSVYMQGLSAGRYDRVIMTYDKGRK